MNKRPSPAESATFFKVGFIKKGNDKNDYIVSVDKNGRHAWKKFDKSVIIKEDGILEFGLSFFKNKLKLKKIGQLQLSTPNVGIGEAYFKNFPATKGTNNIYKFGYGALIIAPNNFTKENIMKCKFEILDYRVDVDTGTFAFLDSGYIIPFIADKNKNGEYYIEFYFDDENTEIPDPYLLYMDDIENAEEGYKNKLIGIYKDNGSGDGSFNVYKCLKSKIYLIMSYEMERFFDVMRNEREMPKKSKSKSVAKPKNRLKKRSKSKARSKSKSKSRSRSRY